MQWSRLLEGIESNQLSRELTCSSAYPCEMAGSCVSPSQRDSSSSRRGRCAALSGCVGIAKNRPFYVRNSSNHPFQGWPDMVQGGAVLWRRSPSRQQSRAGPQTPAAQHPPAAQTRAQRRPAGSNNIVWQRKDSSSSLTQDAPDSTHRNNAGQLRPSASDERASNATPRRPSSIQ